ncbi:MAG: lysoplasmalogenase [Eubacteriales bacterium]|nr:lysoplasmalogenase [Eubacteriales bacterium]
MFAAIAMTVSFLFIMLYEAKIGNNVDTSMIFKLLTSGVFVAAGIIGVILNKQNSMYKWFILSGLIVALIGDFCLAYQYKSGDIWFMIGMGAFVVTHVLFTLGLYQIDGFRWREVIISAVFYGLLAWFLLTRGNGMGYMTVPVLIYMATMAFMCGKAFSAVISRGAIIGEMGFFLILAGVLLFTVSDIILGICMFVDIGELVRSLTANKLAFCGKADDIMVFNAFTYFIGQTLIACSIYYVGRTQGGGSDVF